MGETRQQALRVLREKAPHLHRAVLAGEMKPHAAMIQAGLRRKRVSIRVDTIENACPVLLEYFSLADLEWLVAAARDKAQGEGRGESGHSPGEQGGSNLWSH